MKNKKIIGIVIILVISLLVLIVAIFSDKDTGIEEKIIKDINIGVDASGEMTKDLLLIDEHTEGFYVCVGETSLDHISILSMQYTEPGFSYANQTIISKDELFDEPKMELKANNQKIICGFVDETEEKSIEIDGRTLEVFLLSYINENEVETIGFWYYVE